MKKEVISFNNFSLMNVEKRLNVSDIPENEKDYRFLEENDLFNRD